MLKIKDNIDLEELKKYGFHKFTLESQPGEFDYYIYESISVLGAEHFERLPYTFPRRIILHSNKEKSIDMIYNLIKNGLVEKAEEEIELL